jgi:hypothetical protein
MARYLLIARDSGKWTTFAGNASAADMQAILAKYRAWSQRVAGQGSLKGGEKLRDGQGRVLSGQDKALKVTDGPYVESREVVGGFWLIEADSYDDVVKIAADSPHLQFGTLEIREIEEMT